MEEQKKKVQEEVILKRRIACHPMFGLLKETHLNCLKVCLGDDEVSMDEEEASKLDYLQSDSSRKHNNSIEKQSQSLTITDDLDLFMEAYYITLLELKKAIEEPMKEASAFVEFMHCLLGQSNHPPIPITSSPAASLEEEVGGEQRKCDLSSFSGCSGGMEAVIEQMENFELTK